MKIVYNLNQCVHFEYLKFNIRIKIKHFYVKQNKKRDWIAQLKQNYFWPPEIYFEDLKTFKLVTTGVKLN